MVLKLIKLLPLLTRTHLHYDQAYCLSNMYIFISHLLRRQLPVITGAIQVANKIYR